MRRSRTLAFGAVALTVGAASALVATAPASAATGDVSTGTLNWAVHTSWDTYILNPAWGDDATITPTGDSTTRYSYPIGSGSVTSTTAGAVQSSGGVHWVLPEHYIDLEFDNIAVTVTGTHADIYADVHADYGVSMFGQTAGEHDSTDVKIATSDSASIAIDGTTATITVPGTSIFGTADAVTAGFPYGEGGYNNNAWGETLTATATIAVAPTPTITLSKSTGLDPHGETIHVTGTHFGTNVNATYPPVAGHPAGFYVAFGKYADPWRPSAGAPSANRKNGAGGSGLWWVVPQETYDYVASVYGPDGTTPNANTFSQFVLLQPDGSFSLDLTVAAVQGAITAATPGTYGVYTYGAAGATGADFETYTPISFTSTAPTGPGTETITAEIVATPGGSLTWTIPDNDPVVLGGAVDHGTYLQSTGEINPVTVTDTRINQSNSWTLSGQLGDFSDGGSNTIDGKYLGWTPKIVTAGAGATAGGAVASGWDSGNGLKGGAVLGSATDGHDAGTGALGADLTLKVPAETPAGTYTATLTLTALG